MTTWRHRHSNALHVKFVLLTLGVVSGCQDPGGMSPFGPRGGEDVWAIRCVTLRGPQRFEQAEALASALQRVDGIQARLVHVRSDEDGTSIYYGRYHREPGQPGETAQYRPDHLADLERIRNLMLTVQGQPTWPFYLASMDLLPTYEPTNPEWNLANAEGYWAWHVAVFYNTDTFRSRRSAAEEYCKMLRDQGEPAYYHHGPVRSSVYVGTYPEGALVSVRQENPLSGQVTVTRRIVDPRLLDVQERFPYSLHNGHRFSEVVRRSGQDEPQRLPAESFPVITPRAQRQLDSGGLR